MKSSDQASNDMGVPGISFLWRMRGTVAFVWRSGPGWSIASGVVILVNGLLPPLFLYAIKLLVDAVTGAVAASTSSLMA